MPTAPAPPVPVAMEDWQVLDLLSALVDKSLVLYDEPSGRYRLLETVRQYGRENLEASGETEALQGMHRDWYLALAEETQSKLLGPEQGAWLERLETEHDNLRAALEWCLEEGGREGKREEGRAGRRQRAEGRKQREEGQAESGFQSKIENRKSKIAEVGLRLCAALQKFWQVRGHLGEGRAWCEAALAVEGASGRTAARAKALNGAGGLARLQSDYASARAYHEQSLAIQQEIGDRHGIATALGNLGSVASDQSDFASARTYYEQSLAIQQEIGDQGGIASLLNNLGVVASNQGDYAAARVYYEQSLAIKRAIGDRSGIANSLHNLGGVASDQGDYASARTYYQESLAILREIGNRHGIAYSLESFATLATPQAPAATAPAETAGTSENAVSGLRRAARLWGAAQALREAIGAPLMAMGQMKQDREVAAARERLGEADWAAAWAEGGAMTQEQVIDYALETASDRGGHPAG
jgi:tetratricopeptide (TPR) repeat protein